MVTVPCSGVANAEDAGFTLVELLLAVVVSVAVVGGATLLAGQMQGAYRAQMEAASAQQEARYVIQEIERFLRAAGNNPYRVDQSDCPVPGTPIMAIRVDPNGNGLNDDIRLQMDTNPANGLIGGAAGACVDGGEDVTISYNPVSNVVIVRDNNLGGEPRVLSDSIVTGLEFVFRDVARVVTTTPASIAFVETRVTVRSRSLNSGTPITHVLSSDVRLRSR